MKKQKLYGLILTMLLALPTATLAQAQQPAAPPTDQQVQTAVFAGGCFWCVEEAFDRVEGVQETTSGFTGGTVANPSYKQVTAGGTGHAEVVQVQFNPSKVTYEQLLNVFWTNVDPFDGGGQFCDRGNSYRSALFPLNEAQRLAAEASKRAVEQRFGQTVATKIEPSAPFYPAEDYHQNYHQENSVSYKYYKWRCGRAQRLEEVWEKQARQ